MGGYLKNGIWQTAAPPLVNAQGEFVRSESQFRGWITDDGSGDFEPEAGRYHLYVSYACPWAHRTLLVRALKGLEDIISASVVDPVCGENGWMFSSYPGATIDHVNGLAALHELYTLNRSDYTGRVTVPVLWDKRTGRIVSNESSDIIRMLNGAFTDFQRHSVDFRPTSLNSEIDAMNDFIYRHVNNGVYQCGFATTQPAYNEAVASLFDALDILEDRLSSSRYLMGDFIAEPDLRLFPTLVRFDCVYFIHFKCCLRRITEYPNLANYLKDMYQVPGVAGTVNMDHMKRHYYLSHPHLNPAGIIPVGPTFDLSAPHNRHHFF
ncbi:MAG TPA: glutathione S-transferase family protein [Noviherbaspirillum sp.]|uniref:glutathione S-transferase family protein n=1 Tax=Noviherbaspirillum sp. TaxID=1926288 RepID=UPI002B46C594|nr:glutathione S-transferase family protein [Noviherbaspirillum sp.]HJV86853.1 glutathione S-transferase family protein [Noviherbaspirillum sp.]